MILSQLVDADELNALSPEELRDMISRLDDEVVNGHGGTLTVPRKADADDVQANSE